MGITIHASGKIDSIGDIQLLIDDLKGTAEKRTWTYRVMHDDFAVRPNATLTPNKTGGPAAVISGSLGLKGIILNVEPKVEPLAILFDCKGVLTNMMQQLSWIADHGQAARFTFCKTQFGSIDSHISIIELLDGLKKKYISDLSVIDEGAYWETRDRRILAEKRIALGHCLRHVEKVISSIEVSSGQADDAESIATRIEEALLKSEKEEE